MCIITVFFKVKGQKTTYKFDKLPYDYYPGVTRSLNSVKERKNSPCAENGMSYRHDPGREILWCSPQGQSSTQNEEIPFGIYLHPANSPEEGRIFCAQTTTSNYNGVTRYDAMERLPVNLPRPSMLPFPISPKTQIWFREVAEKNTRGHHASLSSMQSFPFHASAFATPKSSRSNSPSNTLVENESRNVLPSTTYTVETPESSHFNSPLNIQEKNGSRSVTTSVIYPRYFPTAESHRISSPLTIVEQNTSRNITPNDIYQGPFMTLESSNPSSPLNVMENSVSRNVTSPAAAYPPFPVRLTNNVILPTPVCPWVHTVPYQPLVYSVSVPYDPRPVITSVVGNYLGHPTLKT